MTAISGTAGSGSGRKAVISRVRAEHIMVDIAGAMAILASNRDATVGGPAPLSYAMRGGYAEFIDLFR